MDEQNLKEIFSTSVSMSRDEVLELEHKLFDHSTSSSNPLLFKLFSTLFMENSKKWVAIGVAFVIAILTVGGYFIFKNRTADSLVARHDSAEAFATLYLNQGSAKILRDGKTVVVANTTALYKGDKIETSQNAVGDIVVNDSRVAMDENTVLVVNDSLTLKNGNLFINSGTSSMTVTTDVAQVNVSGIAVVTQQGEASVSNRLNIWSFLVEKAYASDSSITKVSVLQGRAKVKSIKEDKEVSVEAGQEVVVNNKLEQKDLDKASIDSEFVQTGTKLTKCTDCNVAKDWTAPIITVKSPKNGETVNKNSVEIVFTSNEDGWFLNENPWKSIKAGEEVKFTAKLKEGKNTIKIAVKDKAYNKTVKTLDINYKAVKNVAVDWKVVPTARKDGIYMKWSTTGAKVGSDAYKVYRNGKFYRSFKIVDSTKDNAWWLDENTTKGKSYTYKISLYQDGKIVASTSTKSVVAITEKPTSDGNGSCSLSIKKSSGQENVTWSVSGNDCGDYHGFKLIWSTSPNPVYPPRRDMGDDYMYYSGTNIRSGHVPGGHTWYVRVCLYYGNKVCKHYSNQLHTTF